jgi:hypothetical protein
MPEQRYALRPRNTVRKQHDYGKEDKSREKANLLSLPVELRLRIYKLLLVSRGDKRIGWWKGAEIMEYQSLMINIGATRRDEIEHQEPTMHPAIVHTCKLIANEATPILYQNHIFNVQAPGWLINFMSYVGDANIQLVRRVHVGIHLGILAPWEGYFEMFDELSRKMLGLRHLEISFTEVREGTRRLRVIELVRAIARIRGLDRLVISGHYATHWQQYFETTMKTLIVAKPAVSDDGPLLEEKASYADWKRNSFDQHPARVKILEELRKSPPDFEEIHLDVSATREDLDWVKLVDRIEPLSDLDRRIKWDEYKDQRFRAWDWWDSRKTTWDEYQTEVQDLIP